MESQLTVYKASAGSGKTFAITTEYVALLLNEGPQAYRHILAVTFTNKATAEMKLRILQSLWELSVLPAAPQPEENYTAFQRAVLNRMPSLTPDKVRERAENALHAILHGYDDFHIETIDSFFQTLLSNLAHELSLSASFKVDINDKQVIDQAVDQLFAQLTPHSPALNWIINYIQQRIDDNKRWDVSREVKRLSHHLNNEHYLLHEEKLRNILDNEQQLQAYVDELKELENRAVDYLHNAAEQLDDSIHQDGYDYAQFSRGSALATYIQNMLNGNPAAPSATVLNYLESPEKWLRATDRKKSDLLEKVDAYRDILIEIEHLRETGERIINSSRLSRSNINPLRLFNEVNHNIDEITRENNSFLLARTPLLFSRIVQNDDASFVFEKSGTVFRHIMIDEFQDTSALQWNNFKNLLIENMAQGNTCLLVGDVKQGIYRFRNGDWNILQNIAHAFRHQQPDIRQLDVNYRSADHVIAFNNALFQSAAAVLDQLATDSSEISDIYADVAQQSSGKPGGRVEIELHVVKKATAKKGAPPEEAEQEEIPREASLAQKIMQLHGEQHVAYKDMAILVRNNSSTSVLLDYFSDHHPDIPLVSDEVFLLSSSRAVQCIVHAFRYLATDQDTIALAYLAQHYTRDILCQAVSCADILRQPESFLPEHFLEQQDMLRQLPLFELTQYIIRTFRLERLENDAPYLFHFQDKLLEYLNKEAADLGTFLAYWDETLYKESIPGGDVAGIRVLTIHKSKGLAFHTVLLPYCDWDIEKDRLDDTLWCEPREAPYNHIPLLPISIVASTAVRQSIYADDYDREHRQRRIENLNLMYVAFTRARQNLFVWAKAKADAPKPTTMGDVLYASLPQLADRGLVTHFQEGDVHTYTLGSSAVTKEGRPAAPTLFSPPANPLEARPTPLQLSFRTYPFSTTFRQSTGAIAFLKDESDDASADRQTDYISQGKLLHHIFAIIRTADDVDAAIAELQAEGVLADEGQKAAIRKLIHQRIRSPRAAGWFDGSWQLYNERAILFKNADGKAQTKRPDRVMVKGDQAVVVDFKFGTPRPEYDEQVTFYCRLLEAMHFQRVEGYLWYVYSGDIKNVYSSANSDAL